jgi:hypothetical protein
MLKLKEGKEYKFLVEKQLSLPDNSNHYLLKASDSKKYLIPAARYSHYGLSPGSEIICRIDRINCRGEIFLEPRNPWYSEGKSYPFIVDGTDIRTDSAGHKHKVVVVLDINRNKITYEHNPSEPFPIKGSKLDLIVERITKGKIFLVRSFQAKNSIALEAGIWYEFVIERIEKGMDDEDYFLIKDPFGSLHTLPRKYYEYYGFSIGTRFKGKIVKYKNNEYKTIEPENPYYKSGDILSLIVLDHKKNAVNQLFTIDLKDEFGFNHCIDSKSIPATKYVRCKVIRVRKGKPLLELL